MALPFERGIKDFVSDDLAQCLFKGEAFEELMSSFREERFVCSDSGDLCWDLFFDSGEQSLAKDVLPPASPAAEWPQSIRDSYGLHCRRVHVAAAQAEAFLVELLCSDAACVSAFIPSHIQDVSLHYRVDLRSLVKHFFASTADASSSASMDDDTYASLLVLIATLERVLSDLMLTVQSGEEGDILEQPPQILRGLLQHPVLVEHLPHGLVAVLHYLMGPPIGMNLRNVLWHGFLHHNVPEVYPMRAFLALLLLLFRSVLLFALNCTAEADTLVLSPFLDHGGAYAVPQRDDQCLLDSLAGHDSGKQCLEDLVVLFGQSRFVLPGRISSLVRSCELLGEAWAALSAPTHSSPKTQSPQCCWTPFGLEKRVVALALLLPQLEHCLRQAFVLANGFPSQLMCASSTVYYTTVEMFLYSEVELSDKWAVASSRTTTENLLLSLMPAKTALLLQELILAASGPRIRDRVAHLVIDPVTIPCQVLDKLVVAFCSLALTWSPTLSRLVQPCVTWMDSWRPLYHPKAMLQTALREAGEGISRLLGVITSMETEFAEYVANDSQDSIDENLAEYLSCLRKGTAMLDEEELLTSISRPYIEYAQRAFPLPLEAVECDPSLRSLLKQEHIFTPTVTPSPCPLPQEVSSVVLTLAQVAGTAVQVLTLVLDDKLHRQRAAILAGSASERMCMSFSKLVSSLDTILLCVRLAVVVAEVELLRLGIAEFSDVDAAILSDILALRTRRSNSDLPRLPRLGQKKLNQIFMSLRKLETRIRRNQWKEAIEHCCSCFPRELRQLARV